MNTFLIVLYVASLALCSGVALGRYKFPIIKQDAPDAKDYKVLLTDVQFDKYMHFLETENDKSVKAQERAMKDYNASMTEYMSGVVLDVANFQG